MRYVTLISTVAMSGLLLAACDQNTASNQPVQTPAAQDSRTVTNDPALRPTTVVLSEESRRFVNETAMGNMYEIDASRIALERSKSSDVKEFAQKMIDEHTESEDDLRDALMQTDAAVAIPASLGVDHVAMIDALKNASDREFDRRYIDQQVEAHTHTVDAMQDYARSGDNSALRNFADKTASVVRMHLEQIKTIDSAHGRRAANR